MRKASHRLDALRVFLPCSPSTMRILLNKWIRGLLGGVAPVSVVIPHAPRHGTERLNRLLKCLDEQTLRADEVIVVSKERSAYRNRNEGWRKARNELVWFLDSDVIPEPDALLHAWNLFEAERPAGIEGHIYGSVERLYEWGFMGGHIFFTRSVLERVGGVDVAFEPGWRGDTDLGWSVLDLGERIAYCPASRVHHPDISATAVRLINEERLRDKHPARFAEAKAKGYLHVFL